MALPTPAEHPRRPPLWVAAVALVLLGMVLGPLLSGLWHRIDRSPGRDDVERVLFVGDSLTFEAASQLEARFRDVGVETRFVGYPGTGLLSGQGWWNRELTHAVETWKPDVVVLQACCNYRTVEPGFELDDGTTIAAGSAAMYDEWEAQARDAVERAGARGAEVFWVTTPAASEQMWPIYQERITRFNEIYASLGVELIDWAGVLTPDGTFASTLPIDGEEVKVRDDDGLHFTAAGNNLVIQETFEAVAPALGIDDGS
jgi:hypothetical protein